MLVDDHPQRSRAAAAEERRRLRGSGPSDPAGPAGGQRLRLSPAERQRRHFGCVVNRRHSPYWGRQCSSATARSGAERQQWKNGEGGAAAPAQPGEPGPKSKTAFRVRGRTALHPFLE
jgi:hypothetical protein